MSFRQISDFFLQNPFLYWTYQGLVGGYKARKTFIEKDVKPKPHMKVLDIGCGPGNIIEYLPNVDYTGVDLDEKYIQAAIKNYGNKGNFVCSKIEDFVVNEPGSFDIAIASGILHHINDSQAEDFFKTAKLALKPSGRLITIDGCYTANQNKIAKLLLNADRGEYIREQKEYERLAETSFSKLNVSIKHNYFNVPYTLIIMECTK